MRLPLSCAGRSRGLLRRGVGGRRAAGVPGYLVGARAAVADVVAAPAQSLAKAGQPAAYLDRIALGAAVLGTVGRTVPAGYGAGGGGARATGRREPVRVARQA